MASRFDDTLNQEESLQILGDFLTNFFGRSSEGDLQNFLYAMYAVGVPLDTEELALAALNVNPETKKYDKFKRQGLSDAEQLEQTCVHNDLVALTRDVTQREPELP